MTRTYLSKWENNHIAPGPEHAANLARELGGHADEYLGRAQAFTTEIRKIKEELAQLRDRVDELERR